MPKAEILAHQNLRRFQLLHQHAANELFGSELRQSAVEAQDESGFQANGGEAFDSLADGFHQRRSIAGRKTLSGWGSKVITPAMACFSGAGDHLAQNYLMAEMQAVEIAHGKHGAAAGGAKARGPFRRRTQRREIAHAATSKLKPS